MAYITNHRDELNKILAEDGLNINMKDQIIKKNSPIFNKAIRLLARKTHEDGKKVPMYLIVLSLDTHFDMKWLFSNVIDDENKRIIRDEVIDVYGLSEEKSIDGLMDRIM